MERSLVLVKPDGVQRALVGEVISRLERRGLRLVAAKFIQVSKELAETHYAIHKGKPFYEGLIPISFLRRLWQWSGKDPTPSPRSVRQWDPRVPTEAAPGSLRHDFALEVGRISPTPRQRGKRRERSRSLVQARRTRGLEA